jgi:serine/threonine-protein kinase
MAVVYLATDLTTGASVALKLLDQDLGAAMGADRFRREIRIASSLSHPHILPVLDAGEAEGRLYFVMPVVTGESLHARLAREEQLPVDDAVRITREVASALAYAHERGIVHRDVKPENILMQDGRALLADFGIARASADLRTTQALTRTGMSLGTPAYMSPEQAAADRELDGRSDQYSLACVLYEMLAGQAPFTAKTAQALMARHMLEPVPALSIVRSTVPAPVEDAIVRAMAKVPADRFATVAQFADALGTPDTWPTSSGARTRPWPAPAPAPRASSGRRRAIVVAAGAALIAAGAGAFMLSRARGPAAAEPPAVMIAIAPFNPLRPEFELWREGVVDVLARNLDGAGPLGTVSPAVAIRGWGTRKADRASARELAERTKAQYAVFGSINAAPGGAVRLNASLLTVPGDTLWEGSWTGLEVKPLADSVTRFVLDRLKDRHEIGAVRRSPLATTDLVALKHFLQGEQHFRRTAWEPALAAYGRATLSDTAFALPLRRMGQVIAFQRDNTDSLARSYALHAGRLNHGLAPRDSLLVVADSLTAVLSQRTSELSDWPTFRRLFATVNEAARRYPADPEVWFAVGEAGEHFGYGTVADVTDEQVLAAFDRAIALDSGFAPAYIHAVELAFQLRGRDAGRRYARAYLALDPTDKEAEGIRLVELLTDPARAGSPEATRLLDTVPTHVLANALSALRRWPDSAETALMLVRTIARRPGTSASHATDSALVQSYLPLQLAYRGRLREAYEALGSRRSHLFAELVLLGGIDGDTASAVFARWLTERSPRARSALPWWAARGDVASIERFRLRAESQLRSDTMATRLRAAHDTGAAPGAGRRARRDSAAALRSFGALSDTLCLSCYLDRLSEARLLIARRRYAEADTLLRQRLYTVLTPAEVWIAVERGRVARLLGDSARAVRAYSLVVSAWQRGDPEVQPMVDEARAALRALGAGGRVAAVAGSAR